MSKEAYHPDGKHIISFREDNHTYIDNFNKRYVSGTTFCKQFFPKFDAIAISKKCSEGKNPKYAGRPPAEIRAEWLAKGKQASLEGDNVHLYAEGKLSEWSAHRLPAPISDRCTAIFKKVDDELFKTLQDYQFIAAEMIVFSPDLGIAGMIDLIMFDPVLSEVLILDYKTNEELKWENPWQEGLPPVEHLQDSDKAKYTLQLSTYQYILDREQYFPDAKGFRRALIHLKPEEIEVIPLEYFEYEVEEMLKMRK